MLRCLSRQRITTLHLETTFKHNRTGCQADTIYEQKLGLCLPGMCSGVASRIDGCHSMREAGKTYAEGYDSA